MEIKGENLKSPNDQKRNLVLITGKKGITTLLKMFRKILFSLLNYYCIIPTLLFTYESFFVPSMLNSWVLSILSDQEICVYESVQIAKQYFCLVKFQDSLLC